MPSADIIVVDDNSPDGTAAVAETVAAELGQIKLLRRPGKQGLGSAYRNGFTMALDEGYDRIVSMDVDFSHDPAVIPEMLRLIDAGADAVIGSRYVPGGVDGQLAAAPPACSRGGATATPRSCCACRSATARPGSAPTGPMHSARSRRRPRPPRATRSSPSSSVGSCGGGFKVMETPIVFARPQRGTSKMSGRIIAESMLLVTRWGLRDVFKR